MPANSAAKSYEIRFNSCGFTKSRATQPGASADLRGLLRPRKPLSLVVMCGEKMNKSCVICQIIASTIPARIVCRDENAIAFFPREMNARGHVVVAPIRHCADIFDIRSDVLNSVMCMAQFLADHCARQLGADGINLLHASGEAAQQSVPHFHIHILPRFRDDDLDAWPDLCRSGRAILMSCWGR